MREKRGKKGRKKEGMDVAALGLGRRSYQHPTEEPKCFHTTGEDLS
jgi:hypothetical protein